MASSCVSSRRCLGLLVALLLGACGGSPAAPAAPPASAPVPDAGVPATEAPVEPPPHVPMELVALSGQDFRAYGWPEDTFRIVCEEPCDVDEAFLKARHQGFAAVKPGLVALAGMDVLPQLRPVYLHVEGDSVCGSSGGGYAGFAFMNWTGSEYRGSHVCLFDVEASRAPPPMVARPLTVTAARSLDAQMLPLHEYGHVLLFLRHEFSYEWLMHALSFRLTGLITELCDERMVTYGARTAYELCQRNGMRWEDLTDALGQMATLYAEGKGTAYRYSGGPSTSAFQLRSLLAQRLGSGTYAACVAGGELHPNQCGDSAQLTSAAGTVSMYAGEVSWTLPAGAVSAPVTLMPGDWNRGMVLPEPWYPFMWAHNYAFLPALSFYAPVRLTVRYDPALLPSGADASTLALWDARDLPTAVLLDSVVDPTRHEVSAIVPGTGRYILAPR